ncbi:ABC transporter permease [Actinorhabdospora filicis]|uniref:ABC transporter permease n=1 Tax=Actinorhabdospora filicis TaxID=1785913 RepID=A0A9W6SPS5_9ACTN|nr:hypothetical protein [Actinorhabdospora filicis]GLZ80740.1 ABC transporter permease [Actinorhabdospora filicis]
MNAVHAEWIKFRTTRATWIGLAAIAATVAGTGALALYVASMYDGADATRRATIAVAPLEEMALFVAQLVFAVLGALSLTAEYRSGLVRTTFTAVPRRWAVLAAKAAVLTAAGLLTGVAAMAAARGLTGAIIGDRPIPEYDEPVRLADLLVGGPSVAMFALIGLGLGALTRSAVATIGTVFALWYIVPIVAMNLPAPWDDRISSIVLTRLHTELAGVDPAVKYGDHMPSALLSPWAAAAVMTGYVLLVNLPGYLRARRD